MRILPRTPVSKVRLYFEIHGAWQILWAILPFGGTAVISGLTRAFIDPVGDLPFWWQFTLFGGIALLWIWLAWFTWPLIARTRLRISGVGDIVQTDLQQWDIGSDITYQLEMREREELMHEFGDWDVEWFLLSNLDVSGGPDRLRVLADASSREKIRLTPPYIEMRIGASHTGQLTPGKYDFQVWTVGEGNHKGFHRSTVWLA